MSPLFHRLSRNPATNPCADQTPTLQFPPKYQKILPLRVGVQCRFAVNSVLPHFAWRCDSIRALSSSGPVRPYIARLSVFRRLIWPSACPLLQGSLMALYTAAMFLGTTRANRMIGISELLPVLWTAT